ncbi:MAG: hypothetical protein DMD36_03535 [Gemmatimonadetes bacterium]|nr:MAG: hypothetical protein DMD36_03535 [Gemmatimonadota bacterium]
MSPRFTRLAWLTAVCTYLLIVLGAIVRITGSGMGCGDHWPLCNGGLFPSLGNLGMLIEWSHRLVAALLSVLVVALAGYAWWLRRETGLDRPGLAAYAALGLLALQVALGAVTVKLALPAWTVILHLGTAMLLLATLIVAARGPRLIPGSPRLRAGSVRAGLVAVVLGFVTVLLGALTANLGAATACLGFPLCNGHLLPDGNSLRLLQWIHRLLAYTLFGYVVWWAVRSKRGGAWAVAALVTLQVVVAAAMVLLALPRPLQAMHVAIGTGVWAALVLAVVGGRGR